MLKILGLITNIMKIVKSFKESRLLIKEITETIKNDTKKQKNRFLPMLLGALAASILRNTLAGKGVIRAGEEVIGEYQKNFYSKCSHEYKFYTR